MARGQNRPHLGTLRDPQLKSTVYMSGVPPVPVSRQTIHVAPKGRLGSCPLGGLSLDWGRRRRLSSYRRNKITETMTSKLDSLRNLPTGIERQLNAVRQVPTGSKKTVAELRETIDLRNETPAEEMDPHGGLNVLIGLRIPFDMVKRLDRARGGDTRQAAIRSILDERLPE